MEIDESEEQSQNAPSSIRESLEPASNVTLERVPHREKQYMPIISTDDGMQIDESEKHPRNASLSIQESLEPASNSTRERAADS
jgi:hypothetical protein